MKLLLDKNADIESKDNFGQKPLSLAAGSGQEAVVKLLLDKNADIEYEDNYDYTPLLLAAGNGHDSDS